MKSGFILPVGLVLGMGGALCIPTSIASAQTSVGFTDASDMEALLSYRLPDWGYRTILASFGLLGEGNDRSARFGCTSCDATSADATESLVLQWRRESEQRQWSLFARQDGDWRWREAEGDPDDAIASGLVGMLSAGASGREYLQGDLSVIGSTALLAEYQESRTREGSDRDLFVQRNFQGMMELGIGFGRLRDVTPVLQAQRLSERLRALGREPLPQEDVLRVASVLAQAGGYSRVFDRANRQLWRDVMEPLIAGGEALTPFEVFYLSEVVLEALGSRQEGFVVDLSGRLERRAGGDARAYESTSWGPNLDIAWSRNLDLDHQLSLDVDGLYAWLDRDEDQELEQGFISAAARHLWVVADRVFWSNQLDGALTYDEREYVGLSQRAIYRRHFARLDSSLSVYVEDHVRLGPEARVFWERYESGEGPWAEDLSWDLRFNITYDLENLLF